MGIRTRFLDWLYGIKRDERGNAVAPEDDKTKEWRECYYRREAQGCRCKYRCVYEGPEDVPPYPDVPQNQEIRHG